MNASAAKVHKPGAEMPESLVVAAEYPDDFVAVTVINCAAMRYKTRNDQVSEFDGDQARLELGRETLTVFKQGAEETPALTAEGTFPGAGEAHVDNFLECVRSRKQPNGSVEQAFHAALVSQMANLSLRDGRRPAWNATTARVERS